jgi:DNA-directed RNA polymerase beta subunit
LIRLDLPRKLFRRNLQMSALADQFRVHGLLQILDQVKAIRHLSCCRRTAPTSVCQRPFTIPADDLHSWVLP